jgi:hypothetical protein
VSPRELAGLRDRLSHTLKTGLFRSPYQKSDVKKVFKPPKSAKVRLAVNNLLVSYLRRAVDFWRRSPPTRRWRMALGAIASVIAIWLLIAPKPWVVAAQIRGKMDILDYVHIYGWIAGAINIALLGVLAAICPWWTGRSQLSTLNSQLSTLNSQAPRWFWPLVVVAMAMTFFYSLPRMNHGFWDDEELYVRTTLYGRFKLNKRTGEVEFKRFKWLETVYGYGTPNNHILFSIASRACEDAWNSVVKPHGFPVVEWPFRVPALVFGVLAVAAMAWLLKEFGLPGAGVAAAFLLGIHPWNIRYASEARGYSLLVFLVPVLFVFWRRAMITGRWRWWGSFAVTEFSLIYCYPGAVFVLIVLNLITLALIVAGRDCAEPSTTQAGRWFCVNVLAAILTLQLMLPLYPQAKQYFDFVSSQGFVSGWPWVRNTVCFMVGGAPWTKTDEPWAGYPEWLAHYVQNPLLFVVAASFAIALILLGAVHLLRRGWSSATFVFVMSVCPPITFVFAYFKRFLLYENYVIYSLPGLVVCAATGLTLAASCAQRLPRGKFIVPATASFAVLGYFLYTNPFRQWIVQHPLQEIRESVIYCRGTLDPSSVGQKSVRTASFCIEPYLYDAHMERFDSTGAFIGALRRADEEGVPLLLNVGMPWAARQYSPQMWSLFSNRELFEEPVHLRGFEPSLDRLVAKYKRHSAENFDFNAYRNEER